MEKRPGNAKRIRIEIFESTATQERQVLKFLLLVFLPTAALAEEIPSYLVNGQIEVKTNDGIKRKYSANEYKMVSREQAERARLAVEKLKRELARARADIRHLRALTRMVKTLVVKNRFTIHGGLGPAGLQQREVDGGVLIGPQRDPVLGIGYARRVFKNMSIGATAITSQNTKSATFVGGLGFDW